MSREPKPFQTATANAALRTFGEPDSPRRFLVADEVGLGKTVVARTVIREMLRNRRKPLVVFYVASNVTIAHQNRSRLLDFLSKDQRLASCAPADRLTLAANPADRPSDDERLHLYTLTPDTSVPLYRRRGGAGRVDERALIYKLISRRFPTLDTGVFASFCRGRAGRHGWNGALWRQQDIEQIRTVQDAFFSELESDDELGLSGVDSNSLGATIDDALQRRRPTWLLGRFRNALALAALATVRPDLIIFDEFQKFRELLIDPPGRKADTVTRVLRGEEGARPPAILLLSATPYRHYISRREESGGRSHHAEFFELIRFLFGDSSRQPREIESELIEFRNEMLSPKADFARLEALQKSLERRLRPVMSRTERRHAAIGKTSFEQPDLVEKVGAEDLRVFTHWVERLRHNDLTEKQARRTNLTSYAVPYWFSIPFPAQMMGDDYVASRHANDKRRPGEPGLHTKDRNRLKAPKDWPHPQLRAASAVMPPERLSRPWLAPSLPWWKLEGLWEKKQDEGKPNGIQPADGKLLVFSRFKAVPPAITSLLSFGMESHLAGRLGKNYDATRRGSPYERAGDANPLQFKADSRGILALFFPAPALIRHTDPRSVSGTNLRDVRKAMGAQVRALIQKFQVSVRRSSKARPLWHLLAALEGTRERCDGEAANPWTLIRKHWLKVAGDAPGQRKIMEDLLDQWGAAAKTGLTEVTEGELALLAEFALSSPGVVLGRALYRFDQGCLDGDAFGGLLDLSWNGLRSYLNCSWFKAVLTRRREHYIRAIPEAVVAGNLESVLDEHLWISSRLDGDAVANFPAELRKVFDLVNGRHRVFEPGSDEFTLRCHAAMPFADAKSDGAGGEQRLRTDDLRRAFNSPFWPHVLATTSLGQEGLDFHVWCRHLLHWDLSHSPLDLEQREGRIQRFGGLSTRTVLAKQLREAVLADNTAWKSPWQTLAEMAEAASANDSSGLSPWWGCDSEAIERHIVKLHHSKHVFRFNELSQQRLLYRLALGQPHQQDFIESVSRLPEDGRQRFALRLSAWNEAGDHLTTS